MAGIDIDKSVRGRLRRFKNRNDEKQTYDEAITELLDEVGWEVSEQEQSDGAQEAEV